MHLQRGVLSINCSSSDTQVCIAPETLGVGRGCSTPNLVAAFPSVLQHLCPHQCHCCCWCLYCVPHQANAVSDKVLDLRKCDYTGKNLSGKTLAGALLAETNLTNTNMREAVLTKVRDGRLNSSCEPMHQVVAAPQDPNWQSNTLAPAIQCTGSTSACLPQEQQGVGSQSTAACVTRHQQILLHCLAQPTHLPHIWSWPIKHGLVPMLRC